jgi:hypothetical protein
VSSGRVNACMLHLCTIVEISVCLSVVLFSLSCLSAVIDVISVLEVTAGRLQGEQFLDTADQPRLDDRGHCIN